MVSDTSGVDRTIFAAQDFSDNSGQVKISPIKWTILATVQSLSMQVHAVLVKKISKKEGKRALRWPQNVQCQLLETAKGKQLSKQTLS